MNVDKLNKKRLHQFLAANLSLINSESEPVDTKSKKDIKVSASNSNDNDVAEELSSAKRRYKTQTHSIAKRFNSFLHDAGSEFVDKKKYTDNLNTLSNNSEKLISNGKDAGISTIALNEKEMRFSACSALEAADRLQEMKIDYQNKTKQQLQSIINRSHNGNWSQLRVQIKSDVRNIVDTAVSTQYDVLGIDDTTLRRSIVRILFDAKGEAVADAVYSSFYLKATAETKKRMRDKELKKSAQELLGVCPMIANWQRDKNEMVKLGHLKTIGGSMGRLKKEQLKSWLPRIFKESNIATPIPLMVISAVNPYLGKAIGEQLSRHSEIKAIIET